MKAFLFTILVLAVGFASLDEGYAQPVRGGIALGTGYSYANFDMAKHGVQLDNNLPAFYATFLFDHPWHSRMRFQWGFRYNRHDYNVQYEANGPLDDIVERSFDITMHYLTFPLNLQFAFLSKQRHFIQAGLEPGVLLPLGTMGSDPRFVEETQSKYFIALNLGVGTTMPLEGKSALQFIASYAYGLSQAAQIPNEIDQRRATWGNRAPIPPYAPSRWNIQAFYISMVYLF